MDIYEKIEQLLSVANKKIIGKQDQILISLCATLSGCHILIEDAPGVGKTTLAYTIAKLSGLEFKRVQFTSDLLPADIIGFKFLDPALNEFVIEKGPIFTDILLADEINRTSPKTQSALLQAMEEKEISIEGEHFQLNKSFVVIATQNPRDQIGTHPLPESQLDRFAVSFSMGNNTRAIEKEILSDDSPSLEVTPVLNQNDFDRIFSEVRRIEMNDLCINYILDVMEKCRNEFNTHLSIRVGKDLQKLARILAFIRKRKFVIIDDIIFFAPYVIGHRINAKSLEIGIDHVQKAISKIPVSIK